MLAHSVPLISSLAFYPLTFSAALHDIRAWETANHPHRLPDDFKSFIQVSDGLLLRWKIRWQDRDQPLGCLHLNRLRDVVPVRLGHSHSSNNSHSHSHSHSHSGKHGHHNRGGDDDDDDSDEDSGDDDAATASVLSAKGARRFPAFDLDSTCAGGRVVFLYRGGGGGAGGGVGGGGEGGTPSSSLPSLSASGPQVWFQDMSSRLFFIAKTFTDYFRLMVMHLGIPCWQYAFTDVGLDPICRQWFRFLSPERLAIDTDKRGGGGGGGGGKGARTQPVFSHVRSTATRPDAETGIVSRDLRGEPKMGGSSGGGSGGGGGIMGQREDAHRWPISSLERKPLTRPSSAPPRRSAAASSGSTTNTVAYSRAMRGFQRGGP